MNKYLDCEVCNQYKGMRTTISYKPRAFPYTSVCDDCLKAIVESGEAYEDEYGDFWYSDRCGGGVEGSVVLVCHCPSY